MHLLVIGATSGIGAKVRDLALERGHSVRAMARSADDLAPRENLEPFAGDATDAADVSRAVQGVDAVVTALGISESVSMLWKEVTLFSESTRVLLTAMRDADVSRLIAVTGFGAGRSRSAMSTVESIGHKAILGKPYEDKDRQEQMIVESERDWTIVRPVILTNSGPSGKYQVLRDPQSWRNGLVSRSDVADYVLKACEEKLDIRADVVLTR